MRDTYTDREVCSFLVQMLKTVSILFIKAGQNTLFGGVAFKFVLETIIHYCHCMLVKSFI